MQWSGNTTFVCGIFNCREPSMKLQPPMSMRRARSFWIFNLFLKQADQQTLPKNFNNNLQLIAHYWTTVGQMTIRIFHFLKCCRDNPCSRLIDAQILLHFIRNGGYYRILSVLTLQFTKTRVDQTMHLRIRIEISWHLKFKLDCSRNCLLHCFFVMYTLNACQKL